MRNCLFTDDEATVRELLRDDGTDVELSLFLRRRLGQTPGPWDQRAGIPQPVAIDVDDRRVAMARVRFSDRHGRRPGRPVSSCPGTMSLRRARRQDAFGEPFGTVLDGSRLWVNGEEADPDTPVGDDDEVAVIPPVSGGCA